MVLFNRIDLTPLHGTGLDVALRAAEDLATRVADGMATGSPIPGLNLADLTRAHLEPTDEGARLTVIAPGFGPNDLDIEIKREMVTVRGQLGEADGNGHKFERSYRTNFAIDADAASADVEHGILKVDLPRHASESAKRVRINGQNNEKDRVVNVESSGEHANDSSDADAS